MATQTEGRQKTTQQHELDALRHPYSVKPVQFMKLPTAMMEAEFSYFTKSSELKVLSLAKIHPSMKTRCCAHG